MNRSAHVSSWTGVILAGGRSSRFGSDKALALLAGRTLLQHCISSLEPHVDSIILSVDHPLRFEGEVLEARVPIRRVADLQADRGPLGGLGAALKASPPGWTLVMSCDTPLVTSELLVLLKTRAQEGSGLAVVPRVDGRWQPLLAAYSTACITIILEHLCQDRLKLIDFLAKIQVECINEVQISAVGGTRLSFLNINRREILEQAEEILRTGSTHGNGDPLFERAGTDE